MEQKIAGQTTTLRKTIAAAIALASFFAVGCASIQRDVLVQADSGKSAIASDFEKRIISLDADFVLNRSLSQAQAQQALEIAANIDASLAKAAMLDKADEARLLALKGRALLLAGNKSEARNAYNQARRKFENDVQVAILSRRLGLASNIASYKNKFEGAAVSIEAAIENFENSNYDIASGIFDSAFLASGGFYREAYSKVRQRAWDLKSVEASDSDVAYWLASQITVPQMMELAQRRPYLLDYYTGGKKMDARRLFQSLMRGGLMESVSKIDGDDATPQVVSERTIATRILAARFLWNLYSTQKNISTTRYSRRYRQNKNAASPVADVPIESEDFDAVLGTVENEIMSLIDGRNFNPDGNITAPEFDKCLRLLK